MIKKLLMFILIGFTAYYALTNMQQLLQWKDQAIIAAQGLVQPLIKNVQANPVPTLTGIAIGATPIILVASKAYTTIKTRLSSQVQQVTDQKNIAELQKNQQITDLQAKLKIVEEENKALISAPTNSFQESLTEAQNLVAQQRQEITSKTATINELHSVIKELKMQVVKVTHVK